MATHINMTLSAPNEYGYRGGQTGESNGGYAIAAARTHHRIQLSDA